MEIMVTAQTDLLMNITNLPGSSIRGMELQSLERKPLLAPLTTQSGDPGPNVSTVVLEIGGMSCTACGNSLEKTLMRLKGVKNASVAFINNKAHVTYDDNVVQVHFASRCQCFADIKFVKRRRVSSCVRL